MYPYFMLNFIFSQLVLAVMNAVHIMFKYLHFIKICRFLLNWNHQVITFIYLR